VDTFLFVRLPYPKGLSLSPSDWIVIDTVVPPGQSASPQLLVILHEKSGADYLAATGRSLGAAGTDQTWIPLSRFQLAGWSKDTDARLNLSEIVEIRVGWGGYLGEVGDQVCFSFETPRVGRAELA
jgi:hypothetical protein